MYLLYTAFPKIYLCINGFPWKSFWFTAVDDQERDLPNLMHYELHAQSKTKSITIKIKFKNIWFDKIKFIFNYKYYEQVGSTVKFTWNVCVRESSMVRHRILIHSIRFWILLSIFIIYIDDLLFSVYIFFYLFLC